MKLIENWGWNKEFANTERNGQNIYFLRDTNHVSPEIQYKLFKAANKKIKHGILSKIFVEADKGEFPNGCKSKKQAIEWCKENEVDLHMVHLLGGEHSKKKDLFYGVDDSKMRELQSELGKRFVFLHKKLSKLELSSDEISQYKKIEDYYMKVANLRSIIAVDNAVDYMNENKIKDAGLVFGDTHFNEMLRAFNEKGIGVISYFPGQSHYSSKESLEYLEKVSTSE